MKKILIGVILLTYLHANWETSIELTHEVMSDSYVEALNSIEQDNYLVTKEKMERATMMCRGQIAMATAFRDDMSNSNRDKATLDHYITMVKYYCAKVAKCDCKRETK